MFDLEGETMTSEDTKSKNKMNNKINNFSELLLEELALYPQN